MKAALAALLLLGAQERPGLDPQKLPLGWKIEREAEAAPADLAAVARKLNARVTRLRYQIVSAGGPSAQINFLECPDEKNAQAAFQALAGARGPDFVSRRGTAVVEYAKCSVLLAKKIRHLLDLGPAAERVYDVRLRAACLEAVDYMQANRVFNLLLGQGREDEIRALTKDWKFGASVRLRTETRPWFRAEYSFDPPPVGKAEADGLTTFTFRDPPRIHGIPYVDVNAEIRVRDAYRAGGDRPSADLRKATPPWPADKVGDLAKRATSAAPDKLEALLAYVHAEIRYDGHITGSRYGVEQVLKQKYGHCWDKADVFVTLCRAAGLPARQVAGWVPALKSGHVWTEVYLEGQGWLPVDPTTPWTGTSDDYLPWFATSDGDMPILYLAVPVIRQRE